MLSLAALESLDEESLSQVTGTGLAIGFEDFRWLVKPTSYFEQVGSDPVGNTTLQRGDLRWYGVNISGAGAGGFHWDESGGNFGTSCDASSLGCPRGGLISDFAPHDNPYLLRAFRPVVSATTAAFSTMIPIARTRPSTNIWHPVRSRITPFPSGENWK